MILLLILMEHLLFGNIMRMGIGIFICMIFLLLKLLLFLKKVSMKFFQEFLKVLLFGLQIQIFFLLLFLPKNVLFLWKIPLLNLQRLFFLGRYTGLIHKVVVQIFIRLIWVALVL